MSSRPRPLIGPPFPGPPYVGALLRLRWQAIRARLLRGLDEAGFDVSPAHMSVLQYPSPEGLRPIEIATYAQLSKQAVNYLIAQLEGRGYLERRTVRGKGRLVFLTAEGHRLVKTLRATVREVEIEWERAIGPKRYREFRETLAQLGELDADGLRPA